MKKFNNIFLHIGLHKTGSTTIQHALHRYRDDLLESHELLFSALGRNHSAPLVAMFHEQPHTYRMNVLAGIDTPAAAAAKARKYRVAFENEMRKSQARSYLLSGEDVSDLSPQGLEKLRDWLMQWTNEVQIVCMVRDPIKWAVSAAQSTIRGGRTYAEANRDPTLLNPGKRLEKFIGVFGREKIKVFSLEEAQQHEAGLTAWMMEKLGYSGISFPSESGLNQNRGMSYEAALIISAINTHQPLFVDGKKNPERFKGDIIPIATGIRGQPFRLLPEAMQRIRESALADQEWLMENFALELPLNNQESSLDADATLSDQSIEDIARRLHKLNVIEDQQKRRLTWKRVRRWLARIFNSAAKTATARQTRK